jgi:menaquinone-dependent protoporphyrinogen oxidase
MKTLILYATKYGASAEIARRISTKFPNATVCNLKTDKIPPLNDFDCVIIGGSIYAGMLRKEAKKFVSENATVLGDKRLGLFLSGLSQNEESKAFTENFPQGILQSAKATSFLGGIFDPTKAKGVDKFIFKAVTKQSDYTNTISDERIDMFVSGYSSFPDYFRLSVLNRSPTSFSAIISTENT